MAPALPLLPLRNAVVYPTVLVPLAVGRRRSLALVEDLPEDDRRLLIATQVDEAVEEAGFEAIHRVATLARTQHVLKMADGTLQLAVQGLERVRLEREVRSEPYLVAEYTPIPEDRSPAEPGQDTLARTALALFQELVAQAAYLPGELVAVALSVEDPMALAYFFANHLKLPTEQRQEILELDGDRPKLERLLQHMSRELEVLDLGRRITTRAEEQIGQAQREYLLREQLKAIQRELGELDGDAGELAELRRRLDAAGMPEEARHEAGRELARLERLPASSPESSVLRNYLELLSSLPWNRSTGGEADPSAAREALDADHYDLDAIKKRVVEHLAVRRLKQQRGAARGREPILCFVGPPGVGKTSLGQSIARAMGRRFTRASLGGVHDEGEIRGHRRTYVGAMPGRILQALRRAEANDPVFMLDEVDKLASDWRGDPSAALLEVLDPEQNREFRDNYLGVLAVGLRDQPNAGSAEATADQAGALRTEPSAASASASEVAE